MKRSLYYSFSAENINIQFHYSDLPYWVRDIQLHIISLWLIKLPKPREYLVRINEFKKVVHRFLMYHSRTHEYKFRSKSVPNQFLPTILELPFWNFTKNYFLFLFQCLVRRGLRSININHYITTVIKRNILTGRKWTYHL